MINPKGLSGIFDDSWYKGIQKQMSLINSIQNPLGTLNAAYKAANLHRSFISPGLESLVKNYDQILFKTALLPSALSVQNSAIFNSQTSVLSKIALASDLAKPSFLGTIGLLNSSLYKDYNSVFQPFQHLQSSLFHNAKSLVRELHNEEIETGSEIQEIGEKLNEVLNVITGDKPITKQELEEFRNELIALTKSQTDRIEKTISSSSSNKLAILLFILGLIFSYCIYLQGKIDSKNNVTKEDLKVLGDTITYQIRNIHLDTLKRITVRPAKLRSKPRHGSKVISKIPDGSTVIVLNMRGCWADTITFSDTIPIQGWILKKYLSRTHKHGELDTASYSSPAIRSLK